jgi:hypothetical protein
LDPGSSIHDLSTGGSLHLRKLPLFYYEFYVSLPPSETNAAP